MTQNGQFCLICNFSNLFPLKWLRMTQNSQFHLINNFSNLFPPKWLRMSQNNQFCMAKKKNTMIQENFYERLHFYMDSCAINPMASLLDYIQLLLSQNEMLVLGLCSTSDDWLSNLSDESHPKCEKMATKMVKN